MTVQDWFKHALGTFSLSRHVGLECVEGQSVSIDISGWLNRFSNSDIDKLAMTANPPYPAPDLAQSILTYHRFMSKRITPVYVVDGVAPPLKDATRQSRRDDRMKGTEPWFDLVASAHAAHARLRTASGTS